MLRVGVLLGLDCSMKEANAFVELSVRSVAIVGTLRSLSDSSLGNGYTCSNVRKGCSRFLGDGKSEATVAGGQALRGDPSGYRVRTSRTTF